MPEVAPALPLLDGEALRAPIEEAPGIGRRRAQALRREGVATVADLLVRLPRRYVDRSRIVSIAEASVGEEVTLIGTVRSASRPPPLRRGRRSPPHSVEVEDGTGRLRCVWFQGARFHTFEAGDVLALSGRIELYRGRRQVSHPEYEHLSDRESGREGLLHTGAVVPLYGASAEMKERGLGSRGFRRLMRAALARLAPGLRTQLPPGGEERHRLPGLGAALQDAHFPADPASAERARRRLAFEELFLFQRELEHRRRKFAARPGLAIPPSQRLVPRLLASVPFEPTRAQLRVIDEIGADMARPRPMRRLLHGDVGSGKTFVALCAALRAVESGHQVALMAPTEILAEQHFHSLRAHAAPAGVEEIALLKGGLRAAVREEILTGLASGSIRIAVGTHALIEEGVSFARLGLAVVDEQHRFGVAQRTRLSAKGEGIDLLIMTATPIPRSLAMTLYGDLAVSVIDEMPPGRQPVRTVLRDPSHRDRILAFVVDEVTSGRQAYVVYPVIDESERSDLNSARAGYEELLRGPLKELRVELLHGRLPAGEKAGAMARFARGEIDVLVATTVIEVGVDVPNATVMIVEHAERFGLAQLHQLRGRVGRGGEAAYCILVDHSAADDAVPARDRLDSLCQTMDGFELARRDMEIRGPGELMGTRQAGMPELRVAHLLRDEDLLEAARAEARIAVDGETGEGGDPRGGPAAVPAP